MNVRDLLDIADGQASNALPLRWKLFEFNRIEERIAETRGTQAPPAVTEAGLATAQTQLGRKYSDLYLYWMTSMIFFQQRETEEYENQRQMFEEAWEHFERDCCIELDRGTACGSAADGTETEGAASASVPDADGEAY